MAHPPCDVAALREALANEERHAELDVVEEAGLVFVRGVLPIFGLEGQELDRYSLSIEVPSDPLLLPVVRETGGRIPWTLERHMFSNGVACVILVDERWKSFPVGAPLVQFLDGPLRNYLMGQSLVDLGDKWPAERRHGSAGIVDYYKEMLETDDLLTVVRFIYLLTRDRVQGHWECACGSGKKVRHCCRLRVDDLRRKIPKQIAERTWQMLGLSECRPYSGDRLRSPRG